VWKEMSKTVFRGRGGTPRRCRRMRLGGKLDGESRVTPLSGVRSRSPEPSFMILPRPTVKSPMAQTAAVTTGNGYAHPNVTESLVPPSSSVSTETDATAAADTVKTRHKSVRMSPQPTFSSTPPVLFDGDDEDGEVKLPWSRVFSMKEEGDQARATRRGAGAGAGKPEDMPVCQWANSNECEVVVESGSGC